MGNEKKMIVAGRRGGKTTEVVEAIKQYIGGISKRDRQRIQQELEQEEDEEPANKYIINSSTTTTTTAGYGIYYIPVQAPQWTPIPAEWLDSLQKVQGVEFADDVQDVNFEE